jgi:ABC-type lipoprotein export system ATPase subunit
MDFLNKLQKNEKVTIVVVTHDLNVAKHAKRLIRLKDGEIIEGG